MLQKLNTLKEGMHGRITGVQGTGLLLSVALDPSRFKSHGANSSEEFMRFHGINVIHGGQNSLRYTPHFQLSSAEVDLMVEATRDAVLRGPAKAPASEAA
jgi:acetylornithine/succinyldiaminopimelate/putrescine aminotransferase